MAIVCSPLTSIIEDKISGKLNSGMLTMHSSCKSSSMDLGKVKLSKSESDFMGDKLTFIYGHPESFATEIGKKVL